MAFYDGLGKRIQKTGQDAIERTKKGAESVRINGAISNLEREITKEYTELGREYYQKYAEGGQDADLTPYFQRINDHMEEIQNYREQLDELKGMRQCPSCGNSISVTAAFCNYCGARQVPEYTGPAQEESEKICPNCGAEVEEGQLFCTECGTSLAAGQPAPEAEPEPAPESDVSSAPQPEPEPHLEQASTEPEEPEEPGEPEEQDKPEEIEATEEEVLEEEEVWEEQTKEAAPTAFCKKCGEPLEPGDLFCTNCGQKVE